MSSFFQKCVTGVNEYVFYPNVNDGCRTFYECVHGEPIIHSCPIGFIFNAVLNICDVPDFVECTHTMHINEVRDPVSFVGYDTFIPKESGEVCDVMVTISVFNVQVFS